MKRSTQPSPFQAAKRSRPAASDPAPVDAAAAVADQAVEKAPSAVEAVVQKMVTPAPVSSSAVDNELTCPVCYGVMDAEIFQCRNGHPICGICREKIIRTAFEQRDANQAPDGTFQTGRCPTCRVSLLAPTRCLVLERMRTDATIRCRMDGCDAVCEGIVAWRAHLAECKFNTTPCPHAGCSERLCPAALHAHVLACAFRRVRCPLTRLDPNEAPCSATFAPAETHQHLRDVHGVSINGFVCKRAFTVVLDIKADDTQDGARWTQFETSAEGDLFVFRATLVVHPPTEPNTAPTGHLTATLRRIGDTPVNYRLVLTGRGMHGTNQIMQSGPVLAADAPLSPTHHMANLCVSLDCLPKYVAYHADGPTLVFSMNVGGDA